jgi:uncharacterized protein (DUF849 family)
MEKLIIEVRANEYTMRDDNPNVPWSAEELAQDAAECAKAGAAIYHYHARMPDGAPDYSAEQNAKIIRAVRAVAPDILVHPTLGWAKVDAAAAVRLEPIEQLCADVATKPDFSPMDMGSTNVDLFDRATGTFLSDRTVYRNPTETLMHFAKRVRELGVLPYVVSWNIGFSRQIEAFLHAGILSDPILLCIIMTDGKLIAGHPGSLRGLQAHLDHLPKQHRIRWIACNYGGDLFPLLGTIISEGGHVSIGLGDFGYRNLGTPRNADLVAFVATVARGMGRELATPAETRAMLS